MEFINETFTTPSLKNINTVIYKNTKLILLLFTNFDKSGFIQCTTISFPQVYEFLKETKIIDDNTKHDIIDKLYSLIYLSEEQIIKLETYLRIIGNNK